MLKFSSLNQVFGKSNGMLSFMLCNTRVNVQARSSFYSFSLFYHLLPFPRPHRVTSLHLEPSSWPRGALNLADSLPGSFPRAIIPQVELLNAFLTKLMATLKLLLTLNHFKGI